MPDADIERARELAEDAIHDSVTPDRLASNDIGFQRYRLHDQPLYRYLRAEEQPEFLFHADRKEPEFNGPGAPDPIERSIRYRVLHLITDERWMMVAGNTEGDQVCELELGEIEAVNYEAGGHLSNNTFVFEIDNAHISVPMAGDYNEDDLETLSEYLRDTVGAVRGDVAVDSDEANYTISGDDSISYDSRDVRNRLDQLPDDVIEDANAVVTEADSVEELIPRLDNLLEEHVEEEEETLDDVVASAESAEELRREVETPSERARRRLKEDAASSAEQMREKVEETAGQVHGTLGQADPEEVGRWAIQTGHAARPMARRSPYPTSLVLLASLTVGASAGIYATGADGGLLADVDPEELGEAMTTLAGEGEELENIDGEAAGALLGAFGYLGGQLAPEEYSKWIREADPEAILAGADAGARFAQDEGGRGTAMQGALAGGGLGMLGSYTADEDDVFRDTVDEDVYKEYLEKLAERNLPFPE